MKRGQMELIGLVVIVILITLGMLFMAQFALKSDPKKKIFVRKGLAYSTMGALMKTEVKCDELVKGVTKSNMPPIGEELIEDCAVNKMDPMYTRCGENKCEFLEKAIGSLLKETLGKWNKHYEFKSELLSGKTPILLFTIKDKDKKGCPKERDSSGLFPLNSDLGIVENVLYVCD
ncbi:hypothetical protein ACFL0E_00675 [Nanoarchaeota archaeon]